MSDDLVSSSPTATHDPIYAGFWRRVMATVVDNVVAVLLMAGLAAWFYRDAPLAQLPLRLLAPNWTWNAISIVGAFVYTVGFESSRLRATPGKLLLGLAVTDLAGRRIGVLRAVSRYFAHALSVLTLMVGYAMVAFTRRRQGLHDKVAGTLVVRRGWTDAQIAAAPPLVRWPLWAATGVVGATLLLPLALLVTAAFVTLSGHSDSYHARTEVAAALYYASDAIDLAESLYGENDNDFDRVNAPSVDIGVEAARTIASIDIEAGSIRITFGGEADGVLSGRTATLTPAVDEEGHIAWICGYADVPDGYRVSRRDYRRHTNISPAALPPDCMPDEAGDEPARPRGGLDI